MPSRTPLEGILGVWTGRQDPLSAHNCALSRSGRPGHPQGRSGAEDGGAVDLAGGAEAIRGGVKRDGGGTVRPRWTET